MILLFAQMVTAAAVKNGVTSKELKAQLSYLESHLQPDHSFILVSLLQQLYVHKLGHAANHIA